MQFVAVFLLALLVFQPKPLVTLQSGASTNAVSVLDHSVCVDVMFCTTLGPAVGNSRATLLFDVDADGALDAFIGVFQGVDVVYLNDGTGSFEILDSGSLSSVGPTFDAAAADLDEDGDPDLAFSNLKGGRNSERINAGLDEEVLAASACAWGDLGGGGGLDLLVVDVLGSDQLLTLGSAGN